ncbi:hypothetical protein N9K44_03165, partial [Flavobacteriaceae bacterium]|nr:hypothetical protein [Flavobacteriaceae bacterium]
MKKCIFTAFALLFLSININAQVYWTGPKTTFSKPNYSDWTQEENQDRITETVWLTRQDQQHIYNIALESSPNESCDSGISNTEWATGTIEDMMAGNTLVFMDFWDIHDCSPLEVVGNNLVLHIIDSDIYIDIRFTFWQSSGNGGGFVYERSNPDGYVPPATIWNSGTKTFYKDGYADWTIEDNQDFLTDDVILTRASNQFLFNIASDTGSIGAGCSSLVTGTEWALGTISDDVENLSYTSLIDIANCSPGTLIDQNLVLHLTFQNIYLGVRFTDWGSASSGAPIGWVRTTEYVVEPELVVEQISNNYQGPFQAIHWLEGNNYLVGGTFGSNEYGILNTSDDTYVFVDSPGNYGGDSSTKDFINVSTDRLRQIYPWGDDNSTVEFDISSLINDDEATLTNVVLSTEDLFSGYTLDNTYSAESLLDETGNIIKLFGIVDNYSDEGVEGDSSRQLVEVDIATENSLENVTYHTLSGTNTIPLAMAITDENENVFILYKNGSITYYDLDNLTEEIIVYPGQMFNSAFGAGMTYNVEKEVLLVCNYNDASSSNNCWEISLTGILNPCAVDSTNPTITAPADVTVNVDAGTCTATSVAIGTPTTSDNCSVSSVVSDAPYSELIMDPNLDLNQPDFTIGTLGTDQWQSFTVGETGYLSNIEVFTNGCVARSFTLEIYSGVGTSGALLYTADYDFGSVCSGWQDILLPQSTVSVTSGSDYTVRFLSDINGLVADGNANYGSYYSNNYGLNPGWQLSMKTYVSPSVLTTDFPLGDTTVTWTVTDGSGNTATATQTVTVVDNIDPTITAPADVTVNVDAGACTTALANVTLGSPTTADN